jgi:type IV secretory pathway VirB2 component (pilin)
MEDNQLSTAPSASVANAQVSPPAPTFVGNSNDLIAVIAATAAGISGICCLSVGYGIYCLPLVGVVLGAVAIFNAKASVNPDRTRRWGWISVGVSSAILVMILIVIGLVIVFYGALVVYSLEGTRSLPAPTLRVR